MEKISIYYEHKTWLPEALVQDAIDNNWTTSLSYFILLRQYYTNNTFYNYTYRNISEKTSISYAVLYRHITKLKAKGMIRIANGNLTLVGSDKLRELYKSYLIPIKLADTKQKTILNLQFTRILRNLNQQYHTVKIKSATKKLQDPSYISSKKARHFIKLRKTLKNEKTITDKYVLSNKKFGSLNNRSKSTGLKIQKQLNEAGLIKSKTNIEKIDFPKINLRAFYAMCLPSNYFLTNKGLILKRNANQILVKMQ